MWDVNLNSIYLQRYIMSHFTLLWWVSSVCEDAARSGNRERMFWSELNFNRFPCSGSRERWTLCREHVTRNTVHARSSLLTSWLSESGVNKQDMHARTGIGNRWPTTCVIQRWENFTAQLVKVTLLQYQEGRSGCWCLPFLLCLLSVRERAGDVSCQTWFSWCEII